MQAENSTPAGHPEVRHTEVSRPEILRAVAWDAPGHPPVLRFSTGQNAQATDIPLAPGVRLGFRAINAGKWCLGYVKVHDETHRDEIVCQQGSAAERGYQCGPCFARDETRQMHDSHRGGQVPAGLRKYLSQPHWLYVATFAGGGTKVGTASKLRQWQRLAEQGAVVAQFVATAQNGTAVRILEDAVTRDAGLPQQIRSAAKSAGLLSPLSDSELTKINTEHARRAKEVLESPYAQTHPLTAGQFDPVAQIWERPALADLVASPAEGLRHAYPNALLEGAHGFELLSLSGACALVRLLGDPESPQFVVDLNQLKGRALEWGEFESVQPTVQDSLF
ncbi:DUF2797 domain-containing protein [Pseudarthrobacter sp. J1763]|uniref:DUF2797 domain-containing protein n=1 Tax=Pseudarthrobacter sp. J1763 TaxID=3420445 RepID=UPI003D2CC6BC